MPVIHISLVAGRREEDIQDCIREVARTVSRTLHSPLASIRVMVNEIAPTRFAVGDILKSENQLLVDHQP